MKHWVILSLLLISVLSLSACETVKGMGRDIHNTGKALEEIVSE